MRHNPGRGVRAFAIQICAQNAYVGGRAAPISKRQDVVKNPIIASGDLVDVAIGENVRFRDRYVAAVIGDVLSTPKGVRFGESRRATRNKGGRLIVTEARKGRIPA